MPKLILKRGVPHKVNTAVADVLITGSSPFLLFMGGSTTPDANSVWQPITPPLVLPKGVGAYIMAGSVEGEVQGAAFDLATASPTNVFPS